MHAMFHLRPIALLAAFCLVSGCETLPQDAFRLSESALATRELQTREYDSVSDDMILAASMAVLQDMGYTIDEIAKGLGVLSASKRADATNDFAAFGSIAADTVKCVLTIGLGCTGNNYGEIDDIQEIRLTLVTRPQRVSESDVSVRITIQRIIWDKRGRISEQETIYDQDVYLALFDKLSTAVFLEREGL